MGHEGVTGLYLFFGLATPPGFDVMVTHTPKTNLVIIDDTQYIVLIV